MSEVFKVKNSIDADFKVGKGEEEPQNKCYMCTRAHTHAHATKSSILRSGHARGREAPFAQESPRSLQQLPLSPRASSASYCKGGQIRPDRMVFIWRLQNPAGLEVVGWKKKGWCIGGVVYFGRVAVNILFSMCEVWRGTITRFYSP